MLRIGLAVVVCALAGVVGCGPAGGTGTGGGADKKASPIVGTWEHTDPEVKGFTLVTTFGADGKVTMETLLPDALKQPNVTIDDGKKEGTYKLDDKSLTMTMKGEEKKMTVKELTADKLVITNTQGKDMEFKKKK